MFSWLAGTILYSYFYFLHNFLVYQRNHLFTPRNPYPPSTPNQMQHSRRVQTVCMLKLSTPGPEWKMADLMPSLAMKGGVCTNGTILLTNFHIGKSYTCTFHGTHPKSPNVSSLLLFQIKHSSISFKYCD